MPCRVCAGQRAAPSRGGIEMIVYCKEIGYLPDYCVVGTKYYASSKDFPFLCTATMHAASKPDLNASRPHVQLPRGFFFLRPVSVSGALRNFQACGTGRLGFGRSFSVDQQLVVVNTTPHQSPARRLPQHTPYHAASATTYQYDPNPRVRPCLTV